MLDATAVDLKNEKIAERYRYAIFLEPNDQKQKGLRSLHAHPTGAFTGGALLVLRIGSVQADHRGSFPGIALDRGQARINIDRH